MGLRGRNSEGRIGTRRREHGCRAEAETQMRRWAETGSALTAGAGRDAFKLRTVNTSNYSTSATYCQLLDGYSKRYPWAAKSGRRQACRQAGSAPAKATTKADKDSNQSFGQRGYLTSRTSLSLAPESSSIFLISCWVNFSRSSTVRLRSSSLMVFSFSNFSMASLISRRMLRTAVR